MTKRCIMCGEPVARSRRKFCSAACAAFKRRGIHDEEKQIIYLSKRELRARNHELEQYGRRICRVHQGAALPLTEEYFHFHKGHQAFEFECKKCSSARKIAWTKARAEKDEAYRQQILAIQRTRRRRVRIRQINAFLAQIRAS